MAENIKKKYFQKRNFYKQIAEFDNNLFIFENWKWLSSRESFSCKSEIRNNEVVGNLFSEKMIRDLLESHNFLTFGKNNIAIFLKAKLSIFA